MAETILVNVLNKKISVDQLLKWLSAENSEETILPEIAQNEYTRTAFISYFLNYLREQCKSILLEVKETQEKPVKKKPGKLIIPSEQLEKGNLPSTSSYVSQREFPDYKSRHTGQANLEVRRASPTLYSMQPAHGVSVVCLGPRLPGASYLQPSTQSGHFPPLPYQLNPTSSSSTNNPTYHFPPAIIQANHSGNLYFQSHSSSENWNHGNISRYQTQPMSSQQFLNNSTVGFGPAGPSSSDIIPNVIGFNQQQIRMTDFNSSSEFGGRGIHESSFPNAPMSPSSPVRHDNSMGNNSSTINSSPAPFSPVSPLYANNSSILCSLKHERSLNASQGTHDDSYYSPNASKTSTPESAGGSGQKNSKSRQNKNLCLGDFMKSESSNKSKKQAKINSTKQIQSGEKTPNDNPMDNTYFSDDRQTKSIDTKSKRRSKKQSKINSTKQIQSGKNTPDDNPMDDTHFSDDRQTKSIDTKSTRRIKPTRLNVSGDQENRKNEVFGVISRPSAVNPKFVEIPSSDKLQQESSFEVERSLLKLERQRQPKSEVNPEIASVETRLLNKTKPEQTIAPDSDLVENIEILDTLALLYSGIFDRNLMSNPMTELYFVMTLLTTQYKAAPVKKSSELPVDTDKSSSAQTLETLKDDLGCMDLSDDNYASDSDSTTSDRKLKEKSSTEDKNELLNVIHSREDKSKNENKKCPVEYLNNAHNCVYFASLVIWNQRYLLSVLDRPTLKLLSENQQIICFRPELQAYLNEIYSVKCLQSSRLKQTDSGTCQTNVCFQVDTDNRETFPSSVAFSLFRKQRDLFYDILKDWEDNHLKPDWSFQRALKNKINSLLTTHTDAVNYCHLAKLFISQLLVSCGQTGKTEDLMNDESLSFLKSLKHVNPEKLLQLKERLVTPLTSMGPVPQPTFPGVQEFYKEFILNAHNWKFYVILENTFISEIMERNETQFAHSEIESTGTTVEENTKQDFISCVSNLRLLAKFTSFTISLPFKSVANSLEWRLSQIQLRGRVVPSLDLQNCLLDALVNRRLSLTVPWIVQYMAMLDPVTFQLPYFVNIGEILYCIYRVSNYLDRCNEYFTTSRQISTLMIFTIGWLFELPNFPRDLYTTWQRNYDTRRIRILDCLSQPRNKFNTITKDQENSKEQLVKCSSALDDLDIIDDRAFYECCPFLTEFKILLTSGNAVLSNSNANRHITPVSSQLSEPSSGIKTKNLQMQIEEAFWHGQPSSVRKTVDFIVEKVASSCVKYICNTIIPLLKQKNIQHFIKSKKIDIKVDFIQNREDDPEDKTQTPPNTSPIKVRREAHVERQMKLLATSMKEDGRRECSEKLSDLCEHKITNSIESLLSDDMPPTVKETCITIAKRTAMERIQQWIDAHIVESFFLKNMNVDLKRLGKEGDGEQILRESQHDENVPSPTEVIEMIRNLMWELLEKQKRWSEISIDYVAKTLMYLQQTLTRRADLIDYAEKNLYTMSVEYCLLLITHRPDLFTGTILEKFLSAWKMNSSRAGGGEPLFVRLISPRNIRMLTITSNSSAMKAFAQLLKALLRENLLSIEALSDQCVALFRQDWPEPVLKLLSQCLKDVVTDYKCSGAQAEGIKYLLDWIASTCDQMEIYD
ncbi:codanin-1 [Venturia canescens]|uniref:codanin-1 n=1 Tax=Venturia canescens TaxID=32260 RepID=UPI001C9D6253|nr:codanin-1 [Venturia canescens]